MFDAVNVIVDAFNRLLHDKPFLFGNRFSPLYSQEDHSIAGIDCSKQYPIAQWKHGKLISEYLKKVGYTVADINFVIKLLKYFNIIK